jgi:hypothetical protein
MKQVIHNQYLLQEVPEGITDKNVFVHFGVLYSNITYFKNFYKRLPPGSWQIVARASEATEEIARGIVGKEVSVYEDYENNKWVKEKTAIESIHSLIRSHGMQETETIILFNQQK